MFGSSNIEDLQDEIYHLTLEIQQQYELLNDGGYMLSERTTPDEVEQKIEELKDRRFELQNELYEAEQSVQDDFSDSYENSISDSFDFWDVEEIAF